MIYELDLHPTSRLQANLGHPPPESAIFEHRKHRVGAILRFRGYSAAETAIAPASVFKRGDLLRVLPVNGCGMGIDVQRLTDGKTDMVWPEEVNYARYQAQLQWDGATVWLNAPDICIARYQRGRFDIHRSAADQLSSGRQCLDCGEGDYAQFRERVLRVFNLELPEIAELTGFSSPGQAVA